MIGVGFAVFAMYVWRKWEQRKGSRQPSRWKRVKEALSWPVQSGQEDWKQFEADARSTLISVRRVAYPPSDQTSEENRALALEATMLITGRLGELGYAVPAASDNSQWIKEQWYPLMLGVVSEIDEKGRHWYYARKRLVNEQINLSEQINTVEAANRCADIREARKAWRNRLTAQRTFQLNPIDEATVLSVQQWLEIVHGICRSRNEPLPPFFQAAFDQPK